MDPLTQTLLGAVTAHAVWARKLGRVALPLGAVGGELADADVLFTPWVDPAVPFELHRHFTHALLFIPVGGMIAALPFLLLPALRRKATLVLAATTTGCATHGLLDTCTSYGTHLRWPFVAGRDAWDSMSIVDPVFTTVLLLGALAAVVRGGAGPARVSLGLALAYLTFGFVQHGRAAALQERIAEVRGHAPAEGRVMPTLGNLVIWRSVYEHDGRLYADALRVPPLGVPGVREGGSLPRFTVAALPDGSGDAARARDVFTRHEAFATDMMAVVPEDAGPGLAVGDMRYSLHTEGFRPLWGLRLVPADALAPVRAAYFPVDGGRALGTLWADLWEPDRGFRPVPRRDDRESALPLR